MSKLWKVHIIGPDEYPFECLNATRGDAVAYAHKMNDRFAALYSVKPEPPDALPFMWAVPERQEDF